MSRATDTGRERGAVLPIVALCLTFLMAGTALSVDIGRLSAKRRDLQSVADSVALDAARRLNGLPTAAVETAVQAAALDSAARNRFLVGPEEDLEVVIGRWDTAAGAFTPTAADEIPNAVRVVTHDTVPFYFQAGEKRTNRQATAMRLLPTSPTIPRFGSVSSFSLASFLAGFEWNAPSGVTAEAEAEVKSRYLNAVLGAFFESSLPDGHLDLTVVSWRGLGAGRVMLDDLRVALGFGTVRELLDGTIALGDLLDATASALTSDGDIAAAEAVGLIRSRVDGANTLSLGRLIAVAQGTEGSAATARFNVLQLLGGAASIIDGRNFAATSMDTRLPNPLTVDPADSLQATLQMAVLSPPVFATGPAEMDPDTGFWVTTASTSQIQVQATVAVPGITLPTLPPATVTAQVPIVLTGADATADLTRIACAEPLEATAVQIDTVTRALNAHIGTAADLASSGTAIVAAPLATVLGVTLTGQSQVEAGGGTDQLLFPVPGHVYDDTNTQRAGGGAAVAVVPELLSSLTIGSSILGAEVSTALQTQLATALTGLDEAMVDPLMEALGISLGGADVTAFHVDCGVPVLVD